MAEVKSGWMHKCGKAVKNWKRRWFVLKPNGYLYYYEGPGKNEKGKIDVIDALKVAPWQEVGSAEKKLPSNVTGENSFAIVCNDRTYTCCCEQDGESLSWMAAIEKVRGAAGSGEQQYPPATYTSEEVQVKQDQPVTAQPPPYTPTSPEHSQEPNRSGSYSGPPPSYNGPPASHNDPPPSHNAPSAPVMGMPDPSQYGGTMPIGHTPQPTRPPPPQNGLPAGGPGYQGAYPVGNYQARLPPQPQYRQPPPQPQYRQPPPQPQYRQPPPQPQYRQPPPRPQYYQQPPPRPQYCPPPRPAYQSYPQRPPPPQHYRPPPPPQQSSTTVTVINLPPVQNRVVYR